MDIFAHALWTTAAYKQLYDKKHTHLSLKWAAFWGVFPDLFAFTIPFVMLFVNLATGHLPRNTYGWDSGMQSLAYQLYNISHSLVIFLVTFLIVWALRRKAPLVMLGWALHILIDVPTHVAEFYATPIFWPISGWKFTHGISWGAPWFMVLNYSSLILVYTYFFYKFKKSS